MINIGIIGTGFMAATHIKAYRQLTGIRLAALCSPSGRNLDGDFSNVAGNVGTQEPLKLDMREVKPYRDYREMLADPAIDLVDICSPTRTHPELAVAALKAGKHVLCEKPLARDSQLAAGIVAAAEAANGFFMPAHCMRFWPGWAWLKQAIDANTFGRVLDARFRRVAQPPGWGHQSYFDAAQSGGALLDLHIHDTDFVQYCFGRPRAVLSRGYTKVSGGIDHILTHYDVDSGALVHAEGSWAMTEGFGFSMAYTVNFENATADFDIARGAEALRLSEKGREPRVVACEGGDGYTGELSHMIESIRTGRPPTVVTARDALGAVQICEAEEQSIRTGHAVSLR